MKYEFNICNYTPDLVGCAIFDGRRWRHLRGLSFSALAPVFAPPAAPAGALTTVVWW